MSTEIVAGWYRDPAEPETQRYWDGEQWVGERLPSDATPPEGPLSATPAAGTAAVAPAAAGAPGATGAAGAPGATVTEPARWAPAPAPAVPAAPAALATVLDRLAARLVDAAALAALNIVVNGWFVYQFLREIRPAVLAVEAGQSTPELSAQAGRLFITIIGVAMALWFAYEVPAIASTGQTLGKRLVGVRVTTADGKPVGFGRAIQRWAIPGLPMMLPWPFGHVIQIADAIWCLWDDRRQCLHDKAAGTVVVPAAADER